MCTNRGKVQRLVAGKVWNSETSSEIQRDDCRGRKGGEVDRKFKSSSLSFADRIGPQILRTRVDVEAFESQSQLPDCSKRFWNTFGIDSELLRPTSHLHARGFELEIRVDPHCYTRAFCCTFRDF